MAHFRAMSTAKLTLFVAACLLFSVTATDPKYYEVVFNIKSENVSFLAEFYTQFHDCLCTRFQCLAYFTSQDHWVHKTTQADDFGPIVVTSNIFYSCTVIMGQLHLRCTRDPKPNINEKFFQTYRLESSKCGLTCFSFIWITDRDNITFRNKNLSPEVCDFIPTKFTSTESYQSRDENNGPPVNVILGVVLGVILIVVIVIVGVVVWKRRKTASKSSDHSSRNPTQTTGTSSEISHEQNSKMKGGGEPYYANTRPSTNVSKPHVSSSGHRNSSSLKGQNVNTSAANSIVQGNNGSNDIDFGYYTAHTVSSEKDDSDISNGTGSAEDNDGNQFNRTSDDYGYAHAEDPSNEVNRNITNKNGPPITVTVHSSVKNANDDYDYAFCDDDEIPAGKKATTNSKDNNEVLSSSSKATPSTTKVKDEYEVVNKNRSVAKGDSINNGVSSQDDAGAWAGISSEAADVYSKLHENERHITDPYDSLLHLNSSSDAGNQSEPVHKLHPANQSSPYDLAQPIQGTSANKNGSSATVEFELVPVSSSAGKSDKKNQTQQGKKQAKKLPYGPEDYAVVIKNKPTNESKAAGFELEN